jgi:hypothetical protein
MSAASAFARHDLRILVPLVSIRRLTGWVVNGLTVMVGVVVLVLQIGAL